MMKTKSLLKVLLLFSLFLLLISACEKEDPLFEYGSLDQAINAGDYKAVKAYIEMKKELGVDAGAELSTQNMGYPTPLMVAAYSNRIKIVKLLLAEGVDINVQDRRGWTAVMHAAGYGYHEIVKLLVDKGADITLKDNEGKTVLEIAENMRLEKIIEILKEASQGK